MTTVNPSQNNNAGAWHEHADKLATPGWHNDANRLATQQQKTADQAIAQPPVPVDRFGKDHWSVFAYCGSCCENGQAGAGRVNRARMRCNPARHPLHAGMGSWKPEYATRLAGFFDYAERADVSKACEAGVMIAGHDDWDCLADLEAAGLLDVISMSNGTIKLTEAGLDAIAKLHRHKVQGQHFSSFVLGCAA